MFLKSNPSLICFDDEGEGEGNGESEGKGKGKGEGEEKTFTQEQVNTFLATEKRRTQETQRQLASELEELRKTAKLTNDEKAELSKRIEELQAQFMTKEEKARQDADRAKKEYDGKLEMTTKERDEWKTKHEKLAIDTELMRCAANADPPAVRYEQISAILAPKTRLVEKLNDEGQSTGEYEPKVSFPDKDKEKKPIILELTIEEAVTRMTELEQYDNLFQAKKKSGLGATGSTGKSGQIDIVKIAKEDPATYRKLRKERPELFRK